MHIWMSDAQMFYLKRWTNFHCLVKEVDSQTVLKDTIAATKKKSELRSLYGCPFQFIAGFRKSPNLKDALSNYAHFPRIISQ